MGVFPYIGGFFKMRARISPKRKAVGSNPAGEAKAKRHPTGGALLYFHWWGFEPCLEVNEAPVGPQSRALSEPAGECENPAGEAIKV